MKLIFLDIDGVLNSFEKHADPTVKHCEWCPEKMAAFGISLEVFPEFLNRVNRIIEETQAKVVLSSSWRIGYLADYADVIIHLHNHGFKGFIVGRTPWLDENEDALPTRGEEIQAWFDQHPKEQIESFVVLDDNPLGDSKWDPNFVRTNHKIGIQELDVEKAIEILNGQKEKILPETSQGNA